MKKAYNIHSIQNNPHHIVKSYRMYVLNDISGKPWLIELLIERSLLKGSHIDLTLRGCIQILMRKPRQ